MASSTKKRTTMAKLNRENALREKRQIKQAKKDAKKQAAAAPAPVVLEGEGEGDEMPSPDDAA